MPTLPAFPLTFGAPLWLLAGLLACGLLVLLYLHADRQRRRALASFAAGHLLPGLTASLSPARRKAKRILFLAGIFLLFAALARPQAGFHWEESPQRGVDILFLVDTSKSMLSQDVKPDRLTRAKLAVDDLAQRLEGDRLGLVAFAGDAFLQCPLTLDATAFRESVDALDTATIPRGGTDIASALREALRAFKAEGGHSRVIVLLTDGDDLEGSAVDAAKEVAKAGVKVYTVGVGTPAGELIPVPDGAGGTQFVRDDAGKPVKSRLDEDRLRRIAEITGGEYFPLGARAEGLDRLLQDDLSTLPRDREGGRKVRVPLERFAWPLALGLALLLAEPLVGTRRRLAPAIAKDGMGDGAAVLLALLLLAAGTSGLRASPAAAAQAYEKGDYAKAEQEYARAAQRSPRPELDYNLGAAAYKNGRFDEAAKAFAKTLQSDRLDLQQQAYYNLGNTLYRQGQPAEKENPQQAIQTWQQALGAYDGALKLRPDDADARFNRDFVAKKLQQLQKQQQQQQKDQKKDQKDQKDKDQKDQKNQQNQNQQGKDQPQDQQSQQQQQNGQNGQNGQSGDQQNQPQNGGQPQAQQPKPGEGQQNPQPKPGEGQQQPQPQPQQGQNQNQNQGQAQGQNAKDQGKEQKGNGAAAQPVSGQMSAEDARNLLDSLRGQEQKLLLNPKGQAQEQPVGKDW